jgi:hypothetical protein
MWNIVLWNTPLAFGHSLLHFYQTSFWETLPRAATAKPPLPVPLCCLGQTIRVRREVLPPTYGEGTVVAMPSYTAPKECPFVWDEDEPF